jgi:hypothetical protein
MAVTLKYGIYIVLVYNPAKIPNQEGREFSRKSRRFFIQHLPDVYPLQFRHAGLTFSCFPSDVRTTAIHALQVGVHMATVFVLFLKGSKADIIILYNVIFSAKVMEVLKTGQ